MFVFFNNMNNSNQQRGLSFPTKGAQNEHGGVGLHTAVRAHINTRNEHGDTLLHMAAFHNNLLILSFLIVNGININAQNRYGNTALHAAAYANNPEVV